MRQPTAAAWAAPDVAAARGARAIRIAAVIVCLRMWIGLLQAALAPVGRQGFNAIIDAERTLRREFVAQPADSPHATLARQRSHAVDQALRTRARGRRRADRGERRA